MATFPSAKTGLAGVTVLDRIGNTPLVRLQRIAEHLPGAQILGKAEWTNPGGSVKDRAASAIVLDALRRGQLGPAAACSTPPAAIRALPMPCWARRWHFRSRSACRRMSRRSGNASCGLRCGTGLDRSGRQFRRRHSQGAGTGTGSAVFLRRPVQQRQQLARPLSRNGHRDLEQTEGRVTHFIAGMGTGGTFMGTYRAG